MLPTPLSNTLCNHYPTELPFTQKEKDALILLQTYLHHKKLKASAQLTTAQRLKLLNDTYKKLAGGMHPETRNLLNASKTIAYWLGSHYKIIINLMQKKEKCHYIILGHENDVFQELYEKAFICLYNYKVEGSVTPITYIYNCLSFKLIDIIKRIENNKDEQLDIDSSVSYIPYEMSDTHFELKLKGFSSEELIPKEIKKNYKLRNRLKSALQN